MRHFGSDPAVVGQALRTERAACTIVGVTQPGFQGTVEDDVVEFFIPIEHYEPLSMTTDRRGRSAWAIGRLKPGVRIADAEGEAGSVLRDLGQQHPEIYARLRPDVEPFGESWRQRLRSGSGVLLAASTLLLLIAAINVGCLLLARVLDRRRELAICLALGAGKPRLVLQALRRSARSRNCGWVRRGPRRPVVARCVSGLVARSVAAVHLARC
ncbi:MAG: hypothetical protein LC791_17650 [Acidobacteria bacterium]|nr:hypothetical protein [Acidobacteriota bacterium]